MAGTVKNKPSINDWTGLGGRKTLASVAKLFNIVYVAGPMTGYEAFNFPAFDQCRDYVNSIEKGRKPAKPLAAVSPADMDRAHGFDEVAASQTPVGAQVSPTFFQDCMRRDIELVSQAFAIILMAGWKQSTGANIELFVARQCGVHVWLAEYDDDGNVNGHVEAPEWLRSPKIYGDDGNPARNDPPALHEEGANENERYLAPAEEVDEYTALEVDQTIAEAPATPGWKVAGVFVGDGEKTVLEEANGLIFGERNADYGHPIDDFSRTGKMWAGVLRDWALTVVDPEHVPDVPPELVGLAMVLVKVSREVNKHKRDNLVDIGGYSGTLAMIADRRAATAASS